MLRNIKRVVAGNIEVDGAGFELTRVSLFLPPPEYFSGGAGISAAETNGF